MNPVLILLLEALFAPFAGLAVVLGYALSRRRGRLAGLRAELPERLGGLSAQARAKLAGRRVWWLHAASTGELGGLVALIEARSQRPDPPAFLVTTTTVAGREAARWTPAVTWAQLAPLDAWPVVARFLAAAKPERLILGETELWPTTLLLAARAGLRPVLVNARLTDKSLRRYRWAKPFLAPALRALRAVGAQGEPDAERFRVLGVPPDKVSVTGNAKYDRISAPKTSEDVDARLQRLHWADRPIFVAGSTHPLEEDAVLAGFLQARARRPDLRLVLAPRHVERADEAWRSLRDASLRVVRWSKVPLELEIGVTVPTDSEALLVDTLGSLPALYARATVAFVGGTLVPVGGHNLLEPALAGVPVLFGPHTGHIELPALLLENGGGGLRVHDAAELGERLADLVGDIPRARGIGAKARELSGSLRGATKRTLDLIEGA